MGSLVSSRKHKWNIVNLDFIAAIQKNFIHGKLLKEFSHTYIAIISKTSNPNTVNQFRPINLSNVCYKVIAKIIANKLKQILPMIISPHQTAFVPRRVIQDNTILAQKVFLHLEKKRGKNGLWLLKLT